MNKEQILESLKKIHPSAKLPSAISFETVNDSLLINVSAKGVTSNMQTDHSAFEGWAIVLKAALSNITDVVLGWENPLLEERKERAHYNRFLMRVANFREGYTWFKVSSNRRAEVDHMQARIESKTIVVNYPKKACSEVSNENKKSKIVLERELERKLVELWRVECPITDEQLPVGLFNEKVSKATTLTPRGSSQIDLWQLDGEVVRVFELKVKGNESVGIISELMFYVCTIKHIVDRRINYPDIRNEESYRHFKDFADAVAKGGIREVKGYFTAYGFHPLLESAQLKESIGRILNDNTLGISFEFKNLKNINQ